MPKSIDITIKKSKRNITIKIPRTIKRISSTREKLLRTKNIIEQTIQVLDAHVDVLILTQNSTGSYSSSLDSFYSRVTPGINITKLQNMWRIKYKQVTKQLKILDDQEMKDIFHLSKSDITDPDNFSIDSDEN